MAKIQTSCPRCRQPVLAEVEQLLDMNVDPKAKQRLLSGTYNRAVCQNCGYDGPIPMPLVYHDPEKELLLTYFPPELGLPLKEQERILGPYIKQVTERLKPEERKAYLFRPQSMFTMQTMIDRVLEADGITREMIEKSQKRLNLIQRLLNATPASRPEIVRQEEETMDQEFFQMIGQFIEASLAGGDRATAQALVNLQKEILPLTALGQQILSDSAAIQTALQELQEAGKRGLTREGLLELMLKQTSPAAVEALARVTVSGLDYEFFNILSSRMENAPDDEKKRLQELRDKLLAMTQEVNRQIQEQMQSARKLVENLLNAPNLEAALEENLGSLDEFFAEALREALDKARQDGDLERSARIQKIVNILQEAAKPPAEYELIEDLLSARDDVARRELLEKNEENISPEFLQILSGLVSQMQEQGQEELAHQLEGVYRQALRFSMEMNMKKG
ncbi:MULTISPECIES: CpXC domain-containing protein [Anaerolinea]|uniref:CpXC domain-containing protein n=1 Tax=Anaerolinea TaxID=233189 RepID=UPI00262BE750|nr:CpXC domain-containing protein [Anaerolinea thermophila]